MKNILYILLVCLCGINTFGQATYKGFPVIKAKSDTADIRLNDTLKKNAWIISPKVENDSLSLLCFSGSENFVFYTDMDSISFELKPGNSHKFYVSLNDTAYAFTIIEGIAPDTLRFDTTSINTRIKIIYEDNNNNEYLELLRSKYHIDSLLNGAKTDAEKALRILHWVHGQWQHNGNNEPKKRDAISILEEVKAGKNFRCVEYGIVTAACLNAIGMKARVLALKTEDVETKKSSAGHVVAEVFLKDVSKWVFLDGQWDAMPVLNGVPLNGVEFREAIVNNFDELEIHSLSNVSKSIYVNWIFPYLYYFDTPLDNREGSDIERKQIEGKSRLMLVSIGAKNPAVFQIKIIIDFCLYTHSLKDFYAEP